MKPVLVINPFGIGDVLFSSALLRALKDDRPERPVYYLCNRKTAPVLSGHPCVAGVVVYERDDFVAARKESLLAWMKMFRGFIRQIRSLGCNCAIDLSLNTQYGFFAWLAGIRQRVGLDYKGRCRFLTARISIAGFDDKHVAEYYLDLLPLLNIARPQHPRLEVCPDGPSRAWAREFVSGKGLPGSRIIGIAPCGGDAFGKDAGLKRWPAEHYRLLIARLLEDRNNAVFIFAGPREKNDVQAILSGLDCQGRVFEFSAASLSQTIALVEHCSLFIGNDTGPLRFADGLGKKIVALFGPVDEKVYGPYPMQEGRTVVLSKPLACRPCYNKFRLTTCLRNKQCLTDISVEDVCSAARSLLSVAIT